MLEEINKLIKTKSKICLSADVDTLKELFELINKVGNYICILKLHHDIIKDFYNNLEYTIEKLNILKKKFNFLIWEDRKFADIQYIIEKQINIHISKWADLISIHPFSGNYISNIKNIHIILIGELSTNSQLFNNEYKKFVSELSLKNDNVIGIVCQNKMTNNKLNIVPGISTDTKTDNKGQNYNLPKDKNFADIFVIGRSIYKSNNPLEKIKNIISLL